jgi:2-amino-4-hydroxy-6-hydroxymethyldihydropteridine diphosphokinase
MQGVQLEAASSLYHSAPFGPADQPDFLNAVVRLRTDWGPCELLACCKRIEADLGRRHRERWRERELDLDLLIARNEDWICLNEQELTLPHSGLEKRAFVLVPLLELNPELVSQVSGQPLKQLLEKDEIRRQDLRLWKSEQAWRLDI